MSVLQLIPQFFGKQASSSTELIDSFRKFLNKSSRFLDSFAVLMGVSTLTFLIVRLNISIKEIKPLIPSLLAAFVLLILFIKQIRHKLFYFGIAASFVIVCSFFKVFPSLLEAPQSLLEASWKYLFLPIIWVTVISLYAIRSYLSKPKLYLNIAGFFFLLFLANALLVSSLEKTSFNKVIKFKTPITLKAGDPLADLRLNPSVLPEALKREEARLGLDKPMWQQYMLWLDGIIVRGDFGLTQQGEPVFNAIKQPLRNTLLLNILVLLFTWLLGVPLGVLAGINKNNFADKLILTFSSLSITTPAFLLTIFILALAVKLGVGEVGGLTSVKFDQLNFFQKIWDIASHLFLPVAILTFVSLGGLIRQMRGNLLDVLNEDYIKAARARGISENKIFWGHALQNAINPLITLLGFEFASLVSGAALTEMILAYPGIGALTLEAAKRLDINLIMFNLLLGTIMLMLGNAFADWLLRKIDPRVA
jgi:peptide/nickel transport system permease protein